MTDLDALIREARQWWDAASSRSPDALISALADALVTLRADLADLEEVREGQVGHLNEMVALWKGKLDALIRDADMMLDIDGGYMDEAFSDLITKLRYALEELRADLDAALAREAALVTVCARSHGRVRRMHDQARQLGLPAETWFRAELRFLESDLRTALASSSPAAEPEASE